MEAGRPAVLAVGGGDADRGRLPDPRRAGAGTALAALLGEKVQGFVCSDRWSAMAGCRPSAARCAGPTSRGTSRSWSTAAGRRRRWGGGCSASPSGCSWSGTCSAAAAATGRSCNSGWTPRQRALERALKAGRRCADGKAATFCANVLELLPAVWRFVVTEGVEPTNNHAERVLRRGVLWRKNAFGCQSEAGCRFVERMLTVVQTRRLQGRSVLDYLYDALVAHRNGLPAPSLLAAE